MLFIAYFCLWIVLIDSTVTTPVNEESTNNSERVVPILTLTLNSLYAVKEIIQSDIGRRPGYFWSIWNQVDIGSIVFVYFYTVPTAFRGGDRNRLVPLAVITTLLLTMVRLYLQLLLLELTGVLTFPCPPAETN